MSPSKTQIVEDAIRRGYTTKGWRIFWPEQFRSSSADEVLQAFRALEPKGLQTVVEVHCENGHPVWTGSPKTLKRFRQVECTECSHVVDEPLHVLVHAELSDIWATELDKEVSKSKKKALKHDPALAPAPQTPQPIEYQFFVKNFYAGAAGIPDNVPKQVAPPPPQRQEAPNGAVMPLWVVITAFFIGVALIGTVMGISVMIPHPSSSLASVLRIVLSLGGAAFAMALTGFVAVHLALPHGNRIAAGGALAVFIILFFFDPKFERERHFAIHARIADDAGAPLPGADLAADGFDLDQQADTNGNVVLPLPHARLGQSITVRATAANRTEVVRTLIVQEEDIDLGTLKLGGHAK